jgi:hypothetical protein
VGSDLRLVVRRKKWREEGAVGPVLEVGIDEEWREVRRVWSQRKV